MKVKDIPVNAFNTAHKQEYIDASILEKTFKRHYKNLDLFECDTIAELSENIDWCYQYLDYTLNNLWATVEYEIIVGTDYSEHKEITYGKTDTMQHGKKEETSYGKTDTTQYGRTDTIQNGRKQETSYGQTDTVQKGTSQTTTFNDTTTDTHDTNTYDNGTLGTDARDTGAHTGTDTVATSGSDVETLGGKDTIQMSGNDVNSSSGSDVETLGGKDTKQASGSDVNTLGGKDIIDLYGHKRPIDEVIESQRKLALWNFYETVARLFASELVLDTWK